MLTAEEIEDRHNSHKLSEKSLKYVKALREDIKDLAQVIDKVCPDSREKNIAHTKLEEALMWAVKAIARHK